jgi:(1->4)-alpha-D-glucan 1-alpha-D-glucosylmutase
VQLRATYRLQLGGGMDFAAVGDLVPYLRELGVSHLYLSPSLQAAPGSTHGYDVVDPGSVSEELGGEGGLRELASRGLGLILDIVPNHMGRSDHNRFWRDPQLRAKFFDIDPVTGFARRFFDVDDLVAVRQENPDVFEATHAKILQLVGDGILDGVRVDHPDGLADPASYLQRLRERGVERVWVEKILSSTPPGEQLREWPVCGTVGYEFLDDVAALFIDPAGEGELTALWEEISGERRAFAAIAHEAKLEQATTTFEREVTRLARLQPRFDAGEIATALASMPIYRTYVEPRSGRVEEADEAAVEASSAAGTPLADVLLARDGRAPAEEEFAVRFQQTSPAVMAKGVEDTAFYRDRRLLALNEVGGDPGRFSTSVEEFHAANAERARRFPQGLLETQTHDTKRSGDARARIGALAALAPRWREAVADLDAIARSGGGGAVAQADRYLILQTLVGVWPIESARLDAYLVKALREAKQRTRWVDPDEHYEKAVSDLADALLADAAFAARFEAFLAELLPLGEHSALGQLLLKLCSPGVPDIYQGDELWRLSLVDPDNRRPVDWAKRRAALARIRTVAAPAPEDRKIFLIHRALALRARRPSALAGTYTPLDAGPHACAFLRGDAEVLAAVALRRPTDPVAVSLPASASGIWSDVLGSAERELIGRVDIAEAFAGPLPGILLLERR